MITRRRSLQSLPYWLATGLGMSGLAACSQDPTTSAELQPTVTRARARVVRIGHQRYDPLLLLKLRDDLATQLQGFGVRRVEWVEFESIRSLTAALHDGSIHLASTSDAAPLFPQTIGRSLLYVGSSDARPQAVAIVVPAQSSIRRLADLRGRRLAVQKNSSAHFLVIRALSAARLDEATVQLTYLSPAAARTAFAAGEVDAWAIWDPDYAAAELQLPARPLNLGPVVLPHRHLLVTSAVFAAENGAILMAVFRASAAIAQWATRHPDQAASQLAPATGLAFPILRKMLQRYPLAFTPLRSEIIAEQQTIADTFLQQGLIDTVPPAQAVAWRP